MAKNKIDKCENPEPAQKRISVEDEIQDIKCKLAKMTAAVLLLTETIKGYRKDNKELVEHAINHSMLKHRYGSYAPPEAEL